MATEEGRTGGAALLPHFTHETLNLGQGTCLAGGHTAWEVPEPSVSDPKARHGDRMPVAGSCTTLAVSLPRGQGPQEIPRGTAQTTGVGCKLEALSVPPACPPPEGGAACKCLSCVCSLREHPQASGASSSATRLFYCILTLAVWFVKSDPAHSPSFSHPCTQHVIAERLLCAGSWGAAATEADPALPHGHPHC